MSKTELQQKLDEAIPQEAIATRKQGGVELSYLSGAYVINRLNQVLGNGQWSYTIVELKNVYEGKIDQYSGEAYTTSYVARIQLCAANAIYEEVGYGDGTDKKSPGKAHELATKEAVTDALKRAAKNLGMSLGLQLYFKEGQYVGETEIKNDKRTEELGGMSSSSSESGNTAVKSTKKSSATLLRKQIKSAYAVLSGQKKITKEEFQKEYTQGIKVDDLDETNINLIITKLKTTFPELGL